MRYLVFPILLMIFIFSCGKNKTDDSCNGNTRREVKIMSDSAAAEIDLTPITSTIDSLENIDVPETKRETPRLSLEKKVYSLTAVVDKVKKEPDGDYHIRLRDGESYLIVEIPNTECEYVLNSPFKNTWTTARNFVETNDLEEKTITVTGVAFVDIDHYYKRKQAKNNIELHPVLDIHF